MIDRLAKAIQDKDWGGVITFYNLLMGNAEVPKKVTSPLSSKRVQEDFSMKRPVPTPTKEPEQPKKRGRPKKVEDNKFEEVLSTIKVEKIEGEDLINDNVQRTPRKRRPFAMVKQVCTLCNDSIEVHPNFKKDPEVFKCDRCLLKGNKGGRT